ncbi:hypothetical protein TNIN_474841, partial [Trichonephila inaurata madagascariensis]
GSGSMQAVATTLPEIPKGVTILALEACRYCSGSQQREWNSCCASNCIAGVEIGSVNRFRMRS